MIQRTVAALLLLAALAAPRALASARLGLGADYVFDQTGLFSLTLAGDLPVARRISVTGRAGALVTSSPATAGVPLDAGVRVRLGRAYLEGLIGPWIFFSGEAVRGHAAFGLGIEGRSAFVGAEVGALGFSGGAAILGARFGLKL
jgi:hypothetical protein